MKTQEISFQKTKLDIAFFFGGHSAAKENLLHALTNRDCRQRAVEETAFLLMKQLGKQRKPQDVTFGRWWSAFSSRQEAIHFLDEAAALGDEIRFPDKAYEAFNDAYLAEHQAEQDKFDAPSLSNDIGRLNTFAQLVEALKAALQKDARLLDTCQPRESMEGPVSQSMAGISVATITTSTHPEAQ